VVLGPQFLGEGMLQISDIHFQIALTSEHVAELLSFFLSFWLSSVQRAGRVSDEELGEYLTKKEQDRSIAIEPKSAVRRPKSLLLGNVKSQAAH